MNKPQVVWHPSLVSREQREAANGHKAAVVWFTGVLAPYEEPAAAELVLDTAAHPATQCAASVIEWLRSRDIIHRDSAQSRTRKVWT